MGVRPPQQGTDETPESIAFGIAVLDERLDGAELYFPATKNEVLDALGDQQVPYNGAGNTIALSTALDETHHNRFEHRQELMNALHPVFEAKREEAKGGFVGRLRSLLPF